MTMNEPRYRKPKSTPKSAAAQQEVTVPARGKLEGAAIRYLESLGDRTSDIVVERHEHGLPVLNYKLDGYLRTLVLDPNKNTNMAVGEAIRNLRILAGEPTAYLPQKPKKREAALARIALPYVYRD